jgi:hypothetical protein
MQATGKVRNDSILREVIQALRTSHPNLVATFRANVHMLGQSQDSSHIPDAQVNMSPSKMPPTYQLFLLQEYCDSGTLYDWLLRERMHPDNVPDLVRRLRGC